MGAFKNITGKRFGRLVVLEPTEERQQGSVIWKCKCDCGNICYVSRSNLEQGYTKSCGCLHLQLVKERNKEIHTKQLEGQRFGRLVAIEPTNKRDGSFIIWKCKCDCGNITYVNSHNLLHKNTFSCGCLNAEKARNNATKNISEFKKENYIENTRIDFLTRTTKNKNNTSGYTGVYLRKKDEKYVAYLEFKGKRKFIGSFDTAEEAAEAREKMKNEIVNPFLERINKKE